MQPDVSSSPKAPTQETAAQSQESRPLHATVRRIGWWVLALGGASGALIYAFAPRPTAAPDWTQDRGYTFAMERMGGKLSVYIAQFNQWLAGLWQGPQLGITIVILAIVVALCCFWLASFLEVPLPDEVPEKR